MFVKENDPSSLLWHGPRTGTKNVLSEFGIDRALPIETLAPFVQSHLDNNSEVLYDLDDNSVLPSDLLEVIRSRGSTSITQKLQRMRVYKQAEEITLMKEASKSSAEAFASTMKWSVKNRILDESSIAARIEYECRLRGASGLAYVPVVAGGSNSLILHYTRNNMRAKLSDLMFMDAGGKFSGYCTDISRAWPLSGKFSDPQKKLYQAVLNVQQACIKICGMAKQYTLGLHELHYLSVEFMTNELGKLGFKEPEKCVDQLYPHNIGHYLGLDLHDCPKISENLPLKPGMVLTVEPGLYIPADPRYPEEFHGIGVRVEDDIVIEENGCTVMTDAVPKEIEAIEDLINS